ncbi:MAG: T9SS type A sorting domain-containing protein [Candidatus Azobacteroides sp.]|nr:T9SS type A sorting domain-containing protein [Candidatus Azobacteroides sp.]
MKIRLLFFILSFFTISTGISVRAQLSYGGKPLPFSRNILRSSGSDDNGLYVNMPSFDIVQMLKEDSIDQASGELRAVRFAKKFETDLTPENSGIRFTTADGTKVWRVGIRSEGAYSLNILFSEFFLPEGAGVFLYNPDQTKILGAFTEKNNSESGVLPVSPVPGDELIVEYQEPADVAFPGVLRISEVNHDYTDILKTGPGNPSSSNTCHQDPICRTDLDNQAQSVCLLILNGMMMCSGSMINNTAQDGTPYLLTSCHCLEDSKKTREKIASTTVVFFNYQSPACNSDIRGTEEMSMVSPELKASDKELDLALLQLDQIPPCDFRPYYAGWDLTPTPLSPYIGIHQPNSGVKKVAQFDGSISTFTDYNIGGISFKELWFISAWDSGTTEGGSSGSPLFDGQLRVIGALTGGNSTCKSPIRDYYWTLKKAWTYYPDADKQLKYWLDPIDSGATSLDGLNPYQNDSCLRISNMERNESFTNYQLANPETGYLFGYNSLQTDEYAEKFTLPQPAELYGVSLVTPVLSSPSSDKKIIVNVYSGTDQPQTVIATKAFVPQYQDYAGGNDESVFIPKNKPFNRNEESYLRFDNPISVDKTFFVSYQLDYSVAPNPFYVYSAVTQSDRENTAYYKLNEVWAPVSSHSNCPVNTSLWINPVLRYRTDTSVDKPGMRENTAWVYKDESNFFHIINKSFIDNAKISVFSLSGKLVQTFGFSGVDYSFYLNHLPKGVYILLLQNRNSDTLLREKIIL